MGGHRFLSDNEELVSRVLALMGDDMLVRRRKSVIFLNGKVFNYPLVAGDLVRNLGVKQNIQALADYLKSNIRRKLVGKPDDSFEDWVVNRFGKTLYEIFFRPYTEKLWGIPARKISSDWASQLIGLLSLWGEALRLAEVIAGQGRNHAGLYYYPKRGFGQLFERIGEEVVDLGVDVRLNVEVRELVTEGSAVVAVQVVENGEERSLPCDYIISSMPLSTLARAISPALPSKVLASCERLQFRAMRLLNLMIDKPDISDNTWTYVTDPSLVMTRIQEPKRRSPYMVPEGKTSLMLEIPCSVEGEVWSMSDGGLLDRCLVDLKSLGIDVGDAILGYFSTRSATAYPIYALYYQTHRSRILGALGRYSNLFPCGRQGVFRYISSNTAMEMGQEAAKQILGEGTMSRAAIAEITHVREHAIVRATSG
jgi:protoporphyrinogen oxidase